MLHWFTSLKLTDYTTELHPISIRIYKYVFYKRKNQFHSGTISFCLPTPHFNLNVVQYGREELMWIQLVPSQLDRPSHPSWRFALASREQSRAFVPSGTTLIVISVILQAYITKPSSTFMSRSYTHTKFYSEYYWRAITPEPIKLFLDVHTFLIKQETSTQVLARLFIEFNSSNGV